MTGISDDDADRVLAQINQMHSSLQLLSREVDDMKQQLQLCRHAVHRLQAKNIRPRPSLVPSSLAT